MESFDSDAVANLVFYSDSQIIAIKSFLNYSMGSLVHPERLKYF